MPGKAKSSVLPVQTVVDAERFDAESFKNIERRAFEEPLLIEMT